LELAGGGGEGGGSARIASATGVDCGPQARRCEGGGGCDAVGDQACNTASARNDNEGATEAAKNDGVGVPWWENVVLEGQRSVGDEAGKDHGLRHTETQCLDALCGDVDCEPVQDVTKTQWEKDATLASDHTALPDATATASGPEVWLEILG
jgi:hypothetical protein